MYMYISTIASMTRGLTWGSVSTTPSKVVHGVKCMCVVDFLYMEYICMHAYIYMDLPGPFNKVLVWTSYMYKFGLGVLGHTYMYIHVQIYIYIEREREKERDKVHWRVQVSMGIDVCTYTYM